MSEFKKPSSYSTLNKMFIRELIKPRNFLNDKKSFISPTDSLISESGKLTDDKLLQIHGMEYSIKELLGENASYVDRILNGDYINFYLSPKDYHRYHSPYALKIKKSIHFSGKLYPVNFKYLRKQPNLFVENERVVLECLTNDDKVIYMVLVGALNVGKMVISFDERIETNIETNGIKVYEYDNLTLKKGECFGYFKMGSTILTIFEKDFIKFDNLTDKKVKFGEIIGQVNLNKYKDIDV